MNHATARDDRARDDQLEVDDFVACVVAGVRPLPDFPLPLMDALGMAVAQDVVADVALPHVDSSAVDGYAVRHADVRGATRDEPVQLPVVGEVVSGRAAHLALSPGTALRIGAGAPVPAGADCVLPLAWTDGGVARVVVTRGGVPGENVRRAGADVGAGDVVLEHGTVLGPRHLGLLAALGRAQVRSRPRPRVVVISTGAELREPGAALTHDSVYDGNSYLLAASARTAGATVYRVGIVPDDVRAFTEALGDQLVRADLVVTTGGTAGSGFDVVREALGERAHSVGGLGGVEFVDVAMTPGGHLGFGHVGEDRVPVLCLPGDPAAAYVAFQTVVLPVLRTLMGTLPVERPTRLARLTHGLRSPAGVTEFVAAVQGSDRQGLSATPAAALRGHYGSSDPQPGDLATANCLVRLDATVTSVEAGEMVPVLFLDEEF
ncbi:gephyrin-like molybdotransferase Glp [Nocardioides yefusunii]|uniref:Molybdopterin molybdenumtransferase n=1 Tax=Nocardioides yefusunii TaxID=2500546 RepID=A0ABW1R0P6_9ACTN|nr:gephyrin-like molybdotransferase Glp [Nocardioides yefusunii]